MQISLKTKPEQFVDILDSSKFRPDFYPVT